MADFQQQTQGQPRPATDRAALLMAWGGLLAGLSVALCGDGGLSPAALAAIGAVLVGYTASEVRHAPLAPMVSPTVSPTVEPEVGPTRSLGSRDEQPGFAKGEDGRLERAAARHQGLISVVVPIAAALIGFAGSFLAR